MTSTDAGMRRRVAPPVFLPPQAPTPGKSKIRRFSNLLSSLNMLHSPSSSRPTTTVPAQLPLSSAEKRNRRRTFNGSSGVGEREVLLADDGTQESGVDATNSSISLSGGELTGHPRLVIQTSPLSIPSPPSSPAQSSTSKARRSLSLKISGALHLRPGRKRAERGRRGGDDKEDASDREEEFERSEQAHVSADPQRHLQGNIDGHESGYQTDETTVGQHRFSRVKGGHSQGTPPSPGTHGMMVVCGWKDETERQRRTEAAVRRLTLENAKKDEPQDDHSSTDKNFLRLPRRTGSQRSHSTVGSVFTEEIFYEALESLEAFTDEDQPPLGSDRAGHDDSEVAPAADIATTKNNADRINGTDHGNNSLRDISNYDDASLHSSGPVQLIRSSAFLLSSNNSESRPTASSPSKGYQNQPPTPALVDPRLQRRSLAVLSGNSSHVDKFLSQIEASRDCEGILGERTASDRKSVQDATAEQDSKTGSKCSKPEEIPQQSGDTQDDPENTGINVASLTSSNTETGVVQPQENPLPARDRIPSPLTCPPGPRRQPTSTPPLAADRHQDGELEKTQSSTLSQLKTMISHQHSASSSAGQPSSFPPYPYAHLYPQQQQPQTSTFRHPHQEARTAPHSHHGHGSGRDAGHQQPQQQQQKEGPVGSQSPWSGNLPAVPASGSIGNASSKAQKAAWWSHFSFARAMKKDSTATGSIGIQAPDSAVPNGVVFGKPLKESLRYANVQISTADSNGELYVWGYIPVVVAKCGLYLKENATEVPGTFRVNGSTKRMRLLQEAFETPPRYGKNLDWKQENYTTHDVASVFRRYLTQMPEPVIPYDLYHQFRDTLANGPINQEEAVAKFKSLIRQMPRANQYLLLYVLDLLSVFARKSDVNLMTATNLAVIFRPGLISHPNHEMSPQEHALSQKVLEFLIAQQDWFMLDIPPPPSRRNTVPHPTTLPTTTIHERGGSENLRNSQPQLSQHAQQSSTTAVHHLSLDQPHSQSHNVSTSVPALSPSGPSTSSAVPTPPSSAALSGLSLQKTTTPPSSLPTPLSSSPCPQRPPISRFGSSSGGRRPLSEAGSEVDDVMIIPGGVLEEEELFSAGPGGGWRLVSKTEKETDGKETEKDKTKRMRRRTTMERSDLQNGEDALESHDVDSSGPSSPILRSPQSNSNGVKRSRTLPASRRNKDEDSKGLASQNTIHAASGLSQPLSSTTSVPATEKDEETHGPVKELSRKGLLLKKGRRASHAVEKERTL